MGTGKGFWCALRDRLTMATWAMGFFANYSCAGDTTNGTAIGSSIGVAVAFALGLRGVSGEAAANSLTAVLVAGIVDHSDQNWMPWLGQCNF